jgi:hypothetical protein
LFVLFTKYFYRDQIKKEEIGGAHSLHGRNEKCNRNLAGSNGSLERHRYRLEDNIKIDLKEIGYEYMNWIHVSQDRVLRLAEVNFLLKIWVS